MAPEINGERYPGWCAQCRRTFWLVSSLLVACGASKEVPPPQVAVSSPKQPKVAAATAEPGAGERKEETRATEVEWGDHFDPVGVLEIVFGVSQRPIAAEISRTKLASMVISTPASKDAWLAMDDNPPRRVGKRRLRPIDLINEDEELAPGSHVLALLRRLSDKKLEVQLQSFSVDVAPEVVGVRPSGCFLFTPTSTFNGSVAADDVQMFVVPFSREVEEVELRVLGPTWRSRRIVAPGARFRLKSPPSGDYSIEVTCRSQGETVVLPPRIVTVNRDAPNPGDLP